MKTIKYLLLGLLIIANFSCSKDDKNESFDIVGDWTITEGFIEPGSFEISMGGMNIPVEVSGTFINIEDDNRLNFKGDNTFSSYTGNIAMEVNMTIMGAPQTQVFEGGDLFGAGTWELNGRELKIHNENGTTIKYHVDNLDGNILELSSNVKDMRTGESNPILDSMDIVVKMKLKRV